MNRRRRVKEEFPPSSSLFSGGSPPHTAAPRAMEGLNEAGPPPFLTKTYEIVEDTTTNHVVSWSRGNNSFVVWDPQSFSLSLLPKYFKHSNFSSFVRQLNTYGFRKVDPDKWEFAHEGFLRGQKHLLKLIRRRKSLQLASDSCVELGRFGLDGELDRLHRDKQVLMGEVVKLRQQQQNTKTYLETMEERLKKTETRQQQMMNFLAKAFQNPGFLQQLSDQKDNHKELEEAIKRKRRRQINQPPRADFEEEEDDEEEESFVDDIHVDVVDLLMNQNDLHHLHRHHQVDQMDEISLERDHLEEGFWEHLLNEANEEDNGIIGVRGIEEEDENEDELVDQFGFLNSNFK